MSHKGNMVTTITAEYVKKPRYFKQFLTFIKGHLIGACGSAETAFVALALSDGKIPGNVNLDCLDDTFQQDNMTFPSEVTGITRSSSSRRCPGRLR